jgi:acetyl esterase/lipase
MHKLGIHVISIGYRLSPIVSLEEMLGDCIDAFTWCNNNLSKELSGDCDITRFAIGGDSSGGSLASLLGLRIQPMAKAIINIYGVSDLVLQQEKYDDEDPPPEPWQGSISEQDVLERLADRDPSHAVTGVAYAWDLSQIEPEVISQGVDAIALGFKRLWGVSDEEWVYNHRVRDQWELKRYIGYSKSMVTSILRINANTPQAEKDERLKAYSMPCLLEMARAYPPTVFLHGTGDNAVPVQESRNMAAGLKEMGVETLESYCEGEDHGWDNRYTVSLLR